MPRLPLDLGPLPQSDRNDELQQKSLAALRSVIPTDRFLLRDERVDDKGVDGSIELKLHCGFTNIRSQYQLKSTQSEKINQDGSFSLSVEVSNLNYILNGPSPIYILWLSSQNELRYLWARDAVRNLYEENPGWSTQGTVTLRFVDKIDSLCWDSIFERILQEGRLARTTHDQLAQSAMSETIVFQIDKNTLDVVTSEQAYGWLTESGLSLSSAGYSNVVQDWIRILPASRACEPRMLLVSGYATHTAGDVFRARSELGRAAISKSVFSAVDLYMLEALLLDCDFRLGKVSAKEMRSRQKILEEQSPPSISLQLRLERLRWHHLELRNPQERMQAASEISNVITTILSDPCASDSLKLRARLVRLHAAAADGNISHIRLLAVLRTRAASGMNAMSVDLASQIQHAFEIERRADAESDDCVRESSRLQHPLLIAESRLSRIVILLVRVINTRSMNSSNGVLGKNPSPNSYEPVLEQIRYAESLFRSVGCDEGVVRCGLLEADWMIANDRPSDAIQTVSHIYALAQAIGVDRYIQRISEHTSGSTEFHVLANSVSNPPDQTAFYATSTDEQLRELASHIVESFSLPVDRLPVVMRTCLSWRAISLEKLNWCQHIEMVEDQRHRLSLDTFYLADPNKACTCVLRNVNSIIPHPDPTLLISSFKNSRCHNCDVRSLRLS